MSEKRVHGGNRLLVAGLAAGLALTGCAEAKPDHTPVPMEQCYDAPLPTKDMPRLPENNDPQYTAKKAEWKKMYALSQAPENNKELALHYDSTIQWFDEDPRTDAAIEQRYKDANVMVDRGEAHGSGFVTTNKKGEQIVVTAAHVVANNDLTAVTVSNNKGEEVGVASGCYIYENKGQKVPLAVKDRETSRIVEYDIAILRLTERIGSTALPIAKTFPSKGTWVSFVNNQLDDTPKYPASYSGVVVSREPNALSGNEVLTGVQPWRKLAGGENSYTLNAGASGGLVGNSKKPEVVGMSIGNRDGYTSTETTAALYDTHFNVPTGNDTGIVPVPATIITPETIRAAVNSPRY